MQRRAGRGGDDDEGDETVADAEPVVSGAELDLTEREPVEVGASANGARPASNGEAPRDDAAIQVPGREQPVARAVAVSTATPLGMHSFDLIANVVVSLAILRHLGPASYGDYVLVMTVTGTRRSRL